jgi:hypothetical protein
MNDAVLQAGPGRTPLTPGPSRWSFRLWLLLGVSLTLLLAGALLMHQLSEWNGVQVSINGWDATPNLGLEQMAPGEKFMLAAVVVICVMASLLIVPLAVMFALMAVLLVILLAVGLPLVLVVGVLTLLLSPLLLIVWLLWKLLS